MAGKYSEIDLSDEERKIVEIGKDVETLISSSAWKTFRRECLDEILRQADNRIENLEYDFDAKSLNENLIALIRMVERKRVVKQIFDWIDQAIERKSNLAMEKSEQDWGQS